MTHYLQEINCLNTQQHTKCLLLMIYRGIVLWHISISYMDLYLISKNSGNSFNSLDCMLYLTTVLWWWGEVRCVEYEIHSPLQTSKFFRSRINSKITHICTWNPICKVSFQILVSVLIKFVNVQKTLFYLPFAFWYCWQGRNLRPMIQFLCWFQEAVPTNLHPAYIFQFHSEHHELAARLLVQDLPEYNPGSF